MKAGKDCETCRRAKSQKPVVEAETDAEALEAVARAAEVGLELVGRKPVVAEEVEPVFDPEDKFAKAWKRRKEGEKKEKAKSKKK